MVTGFLILIIFFALVKCAENERKETGFYNLPVDVLVNIGGYCRCPQKELGSLNKAAFKLFYKEHPYRKYLAERFGIEELKESGRDDDLGFLSTIHSGRDEKYLYLVLSSALFDQNLLTHNRLFIGKYIARIHEHIETKNTEYNRVFYQLPKILLEFKCYKELARIFEVNLAGLALILDSITVADFNAIIEEFSVFDEAQYNRILDHFSFPSQIHLLIALSVLSRKILAKWLVSRFENSIELFKNSFMSVLTKKPKLFEGLDAFSLIDAFLDEIKCETSLNRLQDLVDYFKFLNRLRFTDFKEFSINNFKQDEKFDIAVIAALADKPEIAIEVYERLKKRFDFILRILNTKGAFKLLLVLYEYLEPEEKNNLAIDHSIFDLFMDNYRMKAIQYIQDTDEFSIECSAKSESYSGLPELINLTISGDLDNIGLERFLTNNFSNHEQFTENELQLTIRELIKCPTILEHLRTDSKPLSAPYETLELISRSVDLIELCKRANLKFEALPEIYAKLLENSIGHMRGVLDIKAFVGVTITHLRSFGQFRHLEEFLGMSVDTIFKELIVPSLGNSESIMIFIGYRLMFHYWLRQEHLKDKLKESVGQFYLELLADEVTIEEARFLKS